MIGAGNRLSAQALRLARGSRLLFADLSWNLRAGEALVLRGANGSGKTSLLRVLAGLTAADAGEVRWNDQRWTPLCPSQRAASIYLGHNNALKDELTTLENLDAAVAFDGVNVTSAAMRDLTCDALDAAGLAGCHHLHARRLSQGQKRRVGLARLSLSTKPLWLLDEPTNALDAEGVSFFSAILERHLARGGVACVATHLPLDIAALVQEVTLVGAA